MQVISYKYLGIILDQELNFSLHVKSLIKDIKFKALMLYYLSKMLSHKLLLRVYVSYVLPLIDYADILYGAANADLLKLLQRKQNKCIKTCLGLNILTPTDTVHASANLPLLSERRSYHTKLLAYKRSRLGGRYIQVVNRPTRTNASPLLMYHTIHSAAYEKSPEVICSRLWNEQDPAIRATQTAEAYKILMKQLMLDSIPEIIE